MQRFRRFRSTKTGVKTLHDRYLPKLETMKSLNRVTVESRIFGPKKFKKVVLGVLVSKYEADLGGEFLSRSSAAATDSAVLYEIPSS